VQAPEAQPLAATWERAQTAPHSPQFTGSMAVLAQKADEPAPQEESGEAQVAPHAPPEQTWPAEHAVPQAPQLVLSVAVCTSQPLVGSRSQSAKPEAQAATAQLPPVQVALAWGSTQARPQAPQLSSLVRRLVSQPSLAVPLQSPAPSLQRTTVQAPAAQPTAAAPGSEHTIPHPPQLEGLIAALAQYAVAPAPQVMRGAAQVAPHAPPEHTWPAAQALPQAPQLALSVRVSTSQPLAGLPSQSAKPEAQAATVQAPTVQVAVALGRAHILPQAPQWRALAVRSASQPLEARPSQSP